MATKFPEFFTALAVEFRGKDIRILPKGGRQLSYITARVVMNRLDEVCGPEGWWDEYFPMEHSVLCKLTLRLPDGSTITKCDAGGYAGMSDQGDDDKSGFSDAFKRAAVKFGIGRHLYQDGTARLEPAAVSTPAPASPPKPMPGKSSIAGAKGYQDWLGSYVDSINAKWLDACTGDHGEIKCDAELISTWQLSGHLLKFARTQGLVSGVPDEVKAGERDRYMAPAWEAHREAIQAAARDYCVHLWTEGRAKIKAKAKPREPGADDNMPSPDEDAALDRMATAK